MATSPISASVSASGQSAPKCTTRVIAASATPCARARSASGSSASAWAREAKPWSPRMRSAAGAISSRLGWARPFAVPTSSSLMCPGRRKSP